MKKFLFIALFAASISSCDNLTEGVVRDIDLPPHTPTMVGTLLADNTDSTLYGIISQTRGLLDSNVAALLSGATVNLYKDNVLQYSWNTQDTMDYYALNLNDTLGSASGTYKFEVLHPEFDDLTATDQFPPAAIISEAVLNKGAAQIFTFEADEIILNLQDIPGVDQHYIFSCEVRLTDFNFIGDTSWTKVDLYSDDQRTIQLAGSSAILVSENGIDADLQLSLASTAFLGAPLEEDYEYRISIKTLSNEGFNYYRSLSSYQTAQGNPFSEPVVIYSNVSGGYGVFALSRTVDRIVR